MINTTKADVDEAERYLIGTVQELLYTIRDWEAHPHTRGQLDAARNALHTATEAFESYETALTTWAAGPSGDDRG